MLVSASIAHRKAISQPTSVQPKMMLTTVIVWGVSISTLITLFLIPVLYSRLARFTGSPLAVTRKLEGQLAEGGQRPAPAE